MNESFPIPSREYLSEQDIREVRWLEAAYVEANYTVEYAKYIQHYRLVRLVSQILQKKEEAAVVDLGCGDGHNLFALHQHVGRDRVRYVGMDLDRVALQRAAKRIAYRGYGNIELRVGEVTHTGLPTVSADVILASEVIEHLLQPRLLLAEIRRVLKPDGVALVTTPNLSNYLRRAGDFVDRLWKGRLRECAYVGMIERTNESGFTTQQGILGHVSQQPAPAWRQLALEAGFSVSLRRGGTLAYGYPWLARHPVLFGLLCVVDGLLAFFPWWFDTSHDLLMILQKRTQS
jgi:2-polyprenyl-3-methyl-5-hydroxy-6-metoxy-1,4-benzoquinol methylase